MGLEAAEIPEDIDKELQFVTVDNTEELIKSIKSNTVIRVKEGNYNLSDGYRYSNKQIHWEDNFDGLFPVIQSISNLTLIGEGTVRIVIDPAYGWVMEFKTCQNISLENITFGHTTPGYCPGGVLKFSVSDSVEINNCVLFGSGTYGIELDRTYNFVFNESKIKECSYGLMVILNSGDISFKRSDFLKSKEYELITIGNTKNVVFNGCSFNNNSGSILIEISYDCRDIEFTSCSFENNKTEEFINDIDTIELLDCKFYGNLFTDYTKR